MCPRSGTTGRQAESVRHIVAKLSDDAVQAALAGLSGWSYTEGALSRRFSFDTFPAGIAFVNRVAEIAEHVGHARPLPAFERRCVATSTGG